jgi:hypothetical protein
LLISVLIPICGRCVCFNRFRNNSIDLASWTRIHGTMTACSRAHEDKREQDAARA